MSCQLSFKEQIEGMLDANIEKYPDAVRWMMKKLDGIEMSSVKTDYERFVDRLSGDGPFEGHIYNSQQDNFIALIKWYRAKHGVGLRDAKSKCDDFVQENYYESDRARIARGL